MASSSEVPSPIKVHGSYVWGKPWSWPPIVVAGAVLSGQKSFVFWLFIVNRYYPFCVVIATMTAQLDPFSVSLRLFPLEFDDPTKPPFSRICKPSIAIQIIAKICVTCTAEMILVLRVYALLKGNKVILGVCSLLIAAQGAIAGHSLFKVLAYEGPEASLVAVSGAVHACILSFTSFSSTTPALISFLSLGLALDIIAFVVILSARTQAISGNFYLGKLFKVIQRDGTLYFFVVFSSNLIWLFLILLASANDSTYARLSSDDPNGYNGQPDYNEFESG
ncbi:hypothetical protein ONZ45_g16932 [Pleurotus djamor]|nr:hypothetical protein ONZ45_g16932 [Pleurotus djamor]